jgi:hypothetical protein
MAIEKFNSHTNFVSLRVDRNEARRGLNIGELRYLDGNDF